jgi:hypothetical protein
MTFNATVVWVPVQRGSVDAAVAVAFGLPVLTPRAKVSTPMLSLTAVQT